MDARLIIGTSGYLLDTSNASVQNIYTKLTRFETQFHQHLGQECYTLPATRAVLLINKHNYTTTKLTYNHSNITSISLARNIHIGRVDNYEDAYYYKYWFQTRRSCQYPTFSMIKLWNALTKFELPIYSA